MIYYEDRNGDVIKIIENDKNLTMDEKYPTGAIYLSLSDSNPNVLFGGFWERIESNIIWESSKGFIDNVKSETLLHLDYKPTYIPNLSLSKYRNDNKENNVFPFMEIYVWKKYS